MIRRKQLEGEDDREKEKTEGRIGSKQLILGEKKLLGHYALAKITREGRVIRDESCIKERKGTHHHKTKKTTHPNTPNKKTPK